MTRAEIDLARRGTACRLVSGRRSVPVRRLWRTGLSLGRAEARGVRGLVHLYRGADLVGTGLIVSDGVVEDEHLFHFKRLTLADAPPARDYAPEASALPPHRGPWRAGL